MILPIIAYGDPVLKTKCKAITQDDEELKKLIEYMYETMRNAMGVGLAAPQIGRLTRIFWVDTTAFANDKEFGNQQVAHFSQVFINPRIISETGEKWKFNEGCLSIPGVREDIERHENIEIEYYDQNFKIKKETYNGIIARVIQHEYDHIEGTLFTDYLSSLKKKLLKKKLNNIANGKIEPEYNMKFPQLKRKQ